MGNELKLIENLVASNGTDRAIAIIFLTIVIAIFVVLLKRYTRSLDKQEEIQDRNNKNYINLIKQITAAITKNTDDIGDFRQGLIAHDQKSSENFEQIKNRFNDLESKVDIIEDKTDNVATKTMITEVKEDLKDLRDSLKKD